MRIPVVHRLLPLTSPIAIPSTGPRSALNQYRSQDATPTASGADLGWNRQSSAGRPRSRLVSDRLRLSARRLTEADFRGRVGTRTISTCRPSARRAASPLQGQVAVTNLGALVGGDDADHRALPFEQPGPLAGAERRRRGHVEADLGLGIGGVGVLAAGATGGAEPPLHLVEGNATAPADDQVGGWPRRCSLPGLAHWPTPPSGRVAHRYSLERPPGPFMPPTVPAGTIVPAPFRPLRARPRGLRPKDGSPGIAVGEPPFAQAARSCGRRSSIGPHDSMTRARAASAEWNP